MIEEIERKRESEIKARLEREKIIKSLDGVDSSKLSTLESEKKRELSLLSKERESLADREASLKAEINKRTSNIRSNETALRSKESKFGVSDFVFKNVVRVLVAHIVRSDNLSNGSADNCCCILFESVNIC